MKAAAAVLERAGLEVRIGLNFGNMAVRVWPMQETMAYV